MSAVHFLLISVHEMRCSCIKVHCFPYVYLAILAPSDERIIDLELYSRVIWWTVG